MEDMERPTKGRDEIRLWGGGLGGADARVPRTWVEVE